MKLIIGIAVILLPVLHLHAQAIKPLFPGDKVPTVLPGNIINNPRPGAMLNGFTKGLVILDFMNTYCASCIKALPVLDSLRQRYAGKLEIFMVTGERKERARQFMKTNPIARDVSLPFIVNDTLLDRLFPHAFVSHEVWIYNGIVQAITAADYVTAENINTVLSGIMPNWEVKNDIDGYDYTAPLLELNNNTVKYAVRGNSYGSLITPHLKGVGLRYIDEADTCTGVRTVRAINYPIAWLYLQALTHRDSFSRSHVILQPSPDFFVYPGTGYRNVWEEKNTWCYEATFPAGTPADLVKRKIQADLDAYFRVSSSFTTIQTTCYVLMQDTGLIPPPASENYITPASRASKDQLAFISADHLVSQLNNSYWSTPFYNSIPKHVALPVMLPEKVLTDRDTLKNELKKQHLLLQEVTREAYMLLLSK